MAREGSGQRLTHDAAEKPAPENESSGTNAKVRSYGKVLRAVYAEWVKSVARYSRLLDSVANVLDLLRAIDTYRRNHVAKILRAFVNAIIGHSSHD